ncbi:MAG TPA: tyrosine--tRNA ligase [Candidatus Saccharimonadia bacterium]|nr:tyrosine--tRNA ligase [Candidatus Saccharimonadia bacterium]
MTLSEELAWRGLIKDKTFADVQWLDQPKTFYLGIDASANSLQVGNLAIILLARRLADAGWKAVLVMGGGTSLVGDPGGKTEERQLMSRADVERNIAGVRAQVTKLFSGENYLMVDNYDWLNDLKYLGLLREVGKHFSMTELMQREFVTERMGEGGSGISYAEFSYSIVQGYDYWHLFKHNQAVLQIGGSDQWGNILSGVALIRKKESAEVHALCMPLIINKATGIKFGKSEGGAVWLDPAQTTPTQFYQFWINTDDIDVEEYLKVFTLLSKEEVEHIMVEHTKDPGQRVAQVRLAEEVTALVHGHDTVKLAESVTDFLTGRSPIGEASRQEIEVIRNEVAHTEGRPGDEIADILERTGLVDSKTEGRRIRAAGGVYINGEGVTSETLDESHFQNGRLLLRRGKAFKDSALVEL